MRCFRDSWNYPYCFHFALEIATSQARTSSKKAARAESVRSRMRTSLENMTAPFRRKAFLTLGLLIIFSIPAFAGTFTVFGPKTYVRRAGKPAAVVDTFTVLSPNTQYTLRVANSRPDSHQMGDGDDDDDD